MSQITHMTKCTVILNVFSDFCNGTKHAFDCVFFSCPGQLNRWPCHSVSQRLLILMSSEYCGAVVDYVTFLTIYQKTETLRALKWSSEKLQSWHWGLAVDSQRVPWTAFEILVMFFITSMIRRTKVPAKYTKWKPSTNRAEIESWDPLF